MKKQISRRSFVLAGITVPAAALALPNVGDAHFTANGVIQRIRDHVGTPWLDETVDRIIAGNGATLIHGIATTMMATLEVLQKAVAAGTNMVITHEPTFYSHEDATDNLKADPTFQYKAEFIRKNNLVVFRFHDHWHRRNPDGVALGMTRELGWEKNVDSQNPHLFSFSPIRLSEFVGSIRARLKPQSMRVVGDQHLSVRKVIASWGYISQLPGIDLLARPDVDVLIGGEAREWEVVEYAQDAIASGKKKALVLIGHVASEQAGMTYCAQWLKPLFPGLPVESVPASEPFWMA
jgi:putative NIF3 family GTP cyclohydrolase 1 type 2